MTRATRVRLAERRAARRDPYGLAPTTTTVDQRPVRSLSAGQATDTPEVVLLPGLGLLGYLARWAQATSCWTKATMLDLPGWHGGRARSCVPTLDEAATSTARWLEVTDRRNVILLGHSTGAQSALRTALASQGRLAGLVLAGPTFDPPARTIRGLLRAASVTIPHENAAELPALAPSLARSGGIGLLRFLRSALGDHPEDLVPKLGVPTLFMTGQRDGLAPPGWTRHLADLASGSYVELPGAHNACFTHVDAADEAVRAWTDHLPTPRPRPRPARAVSR